MSASSELVAQVGQFVGQSCGLVDGEGAVGDLEEQVGAEAVQLRQPGAEVEVFREHGLRPLASPRTPPPGERDGRA